MKRHGFTLFELLVVIAIIAILAAILFPVFARAREKARANTCLSNVKQITLGILMYVNDNDERFPPSAPYNGTPNPTVSPAGGGWMTWKGLVYPYVKNAQIFQCPSNMPVTATGELVPGSTSQFTRSYTCNGGNIRIGGGTPMQYYAFNPKYLAEIVKPAECIAIHESQDVGTPGVYWDQAGGLQCSYWFSNHSRQSNFGFCDGHAKSMMPTQTCLTANYWTITDDGPCPAGGSAALAIARVESVCWP